MLDLFRSQGLKSVVYGGLIIAMIVVFAISFGPTGGQKKFRGILKNECAVEVGGECISPRDFKASLHLAAPGADDATLKRLHLRKYIADGLVERTLLIRDAARLGITVTEDEVTSQLLTGRAYFSLSIDTPSSNAYQLGAQNGAGTRNLPVKGPKGEFDQKTYEKSIRNYTGRGAAEYREMQSAEAVAQRMRELVTSRIRIPESEAWDIYSYEKSSAKFKVARLSKEYFAAGVDASDSALDGYIKDHADDINAAFESRKAQFNGECRKARHLLIKLEEYATDDEKVAAKKRAEDAKQRVEKGEKFADVARDVSQDPGSAKDGGSLGCVAKGKMVKPFEDSVFSLKAGELSGVVESKFGYHIIWLEAVLTGEAADQAIKRELAKNALMNTEAETRALDAAKKIREAVASGKPIQEALDSVLSAYEAALPKAPTKDDKKKKDEPKDNKTEPESKPAPLANRPKVEDKEITAGQPLLDDAAPGADVNGVVMALEKPGDTTADVLKTSSGYAIVALVEKKPATRASFDSEKDRFVQGILEAKRREALLNYITKLRDEAKAEIKINAAYTADAPQSPSDADPGDN